MKRTTSVKLGEEGRALGLLRYDQQGNRESAAFEYAPEWLGGGDRYMIEPGLPLVVGPQFHRKAGQGSVFHAAIADTEPDGWGKRVIQRDHATSRQQAKRRGEGVDPRPLNSLDYLLAVDDVARMGALRLQDEEGNYQRTSDPGRRTTPPLIELAQLVASSRAVETNSETEADLAYLRGRGTSLGGLRPKCSVLDEDGALAIGKFPSVTDERAVTKGEVLALGLARKAGINAADARIVDSDGAAIALIRRFDRTPSGQRLMYVSAASMLGAEPGDHGEHSYTEIVDALRRYGHDPMADIEELWRRIAFSILITNVDDHLLNHGFLHVTHGQWRLSPAFDINPFPERLRELKTWISEETGPEASIDALMSVRAYFQISPDRAREILQEVETAVSSWREAGRGLGLSKLECDAFEEAFEHSERDAIRRAASA
jgi:serine/threonine-protein kinase HipA